jgi:hypothetical protein
MLKQCVICSLTILLFATLVHAHGDATHLMGTVTAVGTDTVTIKDKNGKSVVVMLEKTTKYLQNKKVVTKAGMKIGSRVVIDAKMDEKMKMYTAQEVEVGVVVPAKKH